MAARQLFSFFRVFRLLISEVDEISYKNTQRAQGGHLEICPVTFHATKVTPGIAQYLWTCYICRRCLKRRPSYYDLYVLTLDFDLDLSKVDSEIRRRC